MPLRTTLLEFKVGNKFFQDKDEHQAKRNCIAKVLVKSGFHSREMVGIEKGEITPHFMSCFTHSNECSALLHGYPPNLVTLDIHEYISSGKAIKITEEVVSELKSSISSCLEGTRALSITPVHRGGDTLVYFPSTDNRMLEYDFDSCVFEADSDYQNIKIMHSLQYGNMLLLDNDPNLAESDLAYTHAITGYGHEDYTDKTVLILGGGDGGILHELRKENPKFITMVDIDKIVVEQAKKHLRGICYDSLDSLTGDNYEVVIADCVPILKQYVSDGKTFDYVINDLTAIPCTTEPVGDHWDFLRLILDFSMKVLASTGKYYTQGNGANMKSALAMYEEQLKKLDTPVKFSKETVCVPSYLEQWVFYKIWKAEAENKS